LLRGSRASGIDQIGARAMLRSHCGHVDGLSRDAVEPMSDVRPPHLRADRFSRAAIGRVVAPARPKMVYYGATGYFGYSVLCHLQSPG
jgi:hypothetical protein